MPQKALLSALARSFLAGEADADEIVGRASHLLGRCPSWLRPLSVRYLEAFAGQTRPRHREVMEFLARDWSELAAGDIAGIAAALMDAGPSIDGLVGKLHEAFGAHPVWLEPLAVSFVDSFKDRGQPELQEVIRFLDRQQLKPEIKRWITEHARMHAVPAAKTWDLPVIETAGALTDWFRLNPGELEWFADLKGLAHRTGNLKLAHYCYKVLTKRSGGIRLIEAPKSRLKHMHRQILSRILDRIPPHPDVHGFVRGRSIKTFVAPHTGRRVVLRMDVEDFFPSFSRARIQAFFRTAGYPESVADLLGGLCTSITPRPLCRENLIYTQPHLPQGAPTSPALANICFWRVDCRLAGLAKSAGASYTRYADDLAFSGHEDFDRRAERFSMHVAAILLEEGFAVQHRKTRILRQGVRQHMAGLVVNSRANIKRRDFDRLKAILTNCARNGPGDNARAHLEGRVGFVESIHPARGLRLRRIFEKIHWQ